jgi:outer membrane biogenesis lipoprotein LolB
MKNKILVITALCVAAFAPGCKPADEKSTTQQLDKVQTETKQVAQDMKDYTYRGEGGIRQIHAGPVGRPESGSGSARGQD